MWITIESDGIYDPDCKIELGVKVERDSELPRMGFKSREERGKEKYPKEIIEP